MSAIYSTRAIVMGGRSGVGRTEDGLPLWLRLV